MEDVKQKKQYKVWHTQEVVERYYQYVEAYDDEEAASIAWDEGCFCWEKDDEYWAGGDVDATGVEEVIVEKE